LSGIDIDMSGPALTTGGVLSFVFTKTLTSSEADAPSLSVTVNRKTYVPSARLATLNFAEWASLKVASAPAIFVQEYDAIEPSGSDAVPSISTEWEGRVTFLSAPA
jgi:hypothetical protein